MKQAIGVAIVATTLARAAVSEPLPTTELPDYLVYSPRVALQEPVATFAMPVSALRFEPVVDVQARNLAEGQADVTIRGGTFENTGFKIGALSMYDALTGHYFAEIPVAPAFLSAPTVYTGTENALRSWNATTGTVAYDWRRVRTGGSATLSIGDFDTHRIEAYQGWVAPTKVLGRTLGFDASIATSRSDGSRPFGEHAFDRSNGRVQLVGEGGQTDLFYGYQAKSFGWPNLYVPYKNIFETENLQTVLAAINHQQDLGGGDYVKAGAYYRRNKDHYVFNRPDVGAYNPAFGVFPSRHTSYTWGTGIEGQWTQEEVRWLVSATAVADKIRSTSLNFGRSRSRDQFRFVVAPERTWQLGEKRSTTAQLGLAYDDSTRTGGTFSPVAKISLDGIAPQQGLNSVYLSYARTNQLPTYFALNSRSNGGLFRGNANLGRQISQNVELGASGGVGKWTGNVAVFVRRDDDLVDWTYNAATSNARTANAVDIDNAGFEAVLKRTGAVLDLVLSYTGLAKDADYGAAKVDASFYALNYAKHRATAAVTWRVGGGFELRLDNEWRIQETDTLRTSGRGAFLTSVGAYYAPPALKGLRLAAEVENLWNDDFQEVPGVPAARRQASVGISYRW
ncbi:TonB-dependent receptor plug domain-containing protein [Nibricoccus sp. IMCC34717]|uniref:TonB-dependent receptor plug domain-containing protein n=1 Tax=Nibricoccus sp. IMCC34717 TaxID=3034021 RepID=UPI0038507B59